jgi:hypothetical protein
VLRFFFIFTHTELLIFIYNLFSRIIEDYHLKASQIYSLAGKKLARDYRLTDIEQLISCIKNSGVSDTSSLCDSVLILCVQVLAEKQEPVDVEPFVKLIVDTGNKVSYGSTLYCYKFAGSVSRWKFITLQSSIHNS